MNSLSLGVWGSFTAPRSRALGGKSGMTRAAPLVLFLPRRADLRLSHLPLGLACLVLCIALTATPPPDHPHLMTFIQEQPCLDDPTVVFTDPVTRIENSECALASRSHTRGGTRRVSVRSQRAPPR